MVTLIAAGDHASTVTDSVTAGATVVATVIALVAMIVSIVAARKSSRDAGAASKALDAIAIAQQEGRADARRVEPRSVSVVKHGFDGREGIAVSNGSTNSFVYDLKLDFRINSRDPDIDGYVVEISADGNNRQPSPWEFAVLEPSKMTGQNRVFQNSVEDDDPEELVRLSRIRFRDSRDVWWERIGNGAPVQIPPP